MGSEMCIRDSLYPAALPAEAAGKPGDAISPTGSMSFSILRETRTGMYSVRPYIMRPPAAPLPHSWLASSLPPANPAAEFST